MEKKFQVEDIEDSSYHSAHDHQHNFHTIYDKYYLDQIQRLRLSLPWVILSFGLIGNILILIIFTQKLRRRNSNAFCFCALAISDSFALIFMLFRALLKTEILTNLNVTCKLIKFLYHFFLQTSSWCLMLLTFDRLIAVIFVFKYQTWCKKMHVIKIFIGIVILTLLVNLHLLIFVGSYEKENPSSLQTGLIIDRNRPINIYMNNDTKVAAYYKPLTTTRKLKTTAVLRKAYVCNVSYEKYPVYYKYFYKPWDIYHGVIYGAIPFLFIFISNCIIIYKLVKRHKKAAKFKAKNSVTAADPFIKSFQLTVMLLTVAFTFLVLTSPISIYMAFLYENLTSVRESKREFIKVVLRYVGYINNAINFYIYFSTSNEFRKEVGELFKCLLPTAKGGSSIYTACTTSTSLPDINIETKPIRKKEPVSLKSFNTHLTQVEQEILNNNNDRDDDSFKKESENRKPVHQIRYDKKLDINNKQELKAFLNNSNDNVKITSV